MSAPPTVLLKVFRSGPADRARRYDEFRVPVGPRTTVLDALLAVRRREDPSLTVRHSCLHGSCGTCGMRVNGREVLACVTRLDGLGDPVVVEPLAGAPVVGDLVVDMEHLFRRLEPAGRWSGPASGPGRAGPRRRSRVSSWRSWSGSRTAWNAGSACRPARSPAIPATWGRSPWPRPSGSWPSRAAPTRGRCWAGSTTPTGPGAAMRRSSARRSARPGSTRPGQSCACAAGCCATGCPGWSAGTTGRCSHDAGVS
jgi:2Fe-2S iron-sulfur cluster binding domain